MTFFFALYVRARFSEPVDWRAVMHWQLTGLRTSCARPPAKKMSANQSFFMSVFPSRWRAFLGLFFGARAQGTIGAVVVLADRPQR
jgi:hypothetical protein